MLLLLLSWLLLLLQSLCLSVVVDFILETSKATLFFTFQITHPNNRKLHKQHRWDLEILYVTLLSRG